MHTLQIVGVCQLAFTDCELCYRGLYQNHLQAASMPTHDQSDFYFCIDTIIASCQQQCQPLFLFFLYTQDVNACSLCSFQAQSYCTQMPGWYEGLTANDEGSFW